MRCVVCDQAGMLPAATSVLLERDELHLLIRNVPAQVCPNCGEAYADEQVTAIILRTAERLALAGTKKEEIEYAMTGA